MEIIRNAINCKIELSLKWIENCILSSSGTAAIFKITDTKLYVPIVTLSAEGNTKLSKLLSDRFKRSIYWSKYKVTDNILVQIATNNEEKYIREFLIQVIKEFKDYLFLLIIIRKVVVRFLLILLENIFFQELK